MRSIAICLASFSCWLVVSLETTLLRAAEPIPDKLVVLTFDDSVASHYSVVRPLLKRFGFSATFFITEGFSFRTNKTDYMTWEQIAELHRDGFEIGNHTRDHMGINAGNIDRVREQIEAINERCAEHGIPRPISFAYPGNAFHTNALAVLRELGIRWARRGSAPEFAYETGNGMAFEPGEDHPLLIPTAGDARPDWTLEDFKRAVQQARNGRIAVLQFHGVPDREHPWVHTPPEKFETYLNYLKQNGYRVIALRDLERYVNSTIPHADPLRAIRRRQQNPEQWTVLRGRVVDAKSGAVLPSRVYIEGPSGTWHFPDSSVVQGSAISYQKQNWLNRQSVEMHTTLSAHPFEIALRPGRYTIRVEHGKEWLPFSREIDIGSEPLDIAVPLQRWIDMAALGWYSGDTHVHRSVEELRNVIAAEDLNVALPLTYWVTHGFRPPNQGDKTVAEADTQLVKVDSTHVIYPRNTEYEIFTIDERRHTLGAFFVLNHKSVLTNGVPPVAAVGRRARAEGALIDLDKHDWPWSIALIPVLPVDLFELANNHIWQAQFAFTNWNSPAPEWMQLPNAGRSGGERDWIEYGFKTYYTLLNCGFHLRPTAGTANGVHPVPLGFGRVYVRLNEPFNYESWIAGLNAGRSFVTTGPMLFAQLNGHDPGHHFSDRPDVLRLTGRIVSPDPVSRIEVIVNGDLTKKLTVANSATASGGFENPFDSSISMPESGWIAVRCYSERPDGRIRFAHSAPFYVAIQKQPRRPTAAEVDFLVRRVQSEIDRSKAILPAEAIAEYEKALQIYKSVPHRAD